VDGLPAVQVREEPCAPLAPDAYPTPLPVVVQQDNSKFLEASRQAFGVSRNQRNRAIHGLGSTNRVHAQPYRGREFLDLEAQRRSGSPQLDAGGR